MKKPKSKASAYDVLRRLIRMYGNACRMDEMKGGGDPADYDAIETEMKLARMRLESHITKMEREET